VIFPHFKVVAFLVALHQNGPLLGSSGLLPAQQYLDNVETRTGAEAGVTMATVTACPSLVWLIDYHQHLDWFLDAAAYMGTCIY